MKSVTLAVSAMLAVALIAPAAATSSDSTVYSPTFLDVGDDHAFAGEIRTLAANAITRGCDEAGRLFCPERGVTRGEMAAFLVRALGLSEVGEVAFLDADGSVFEADIAALAAAGVTKGCNPPGNDMFCPDRGVTRGEMAVFLVRGLGLAAVPALPEGVRLARATQPGPGEATQVTVCQNGGPVEVRNAAWAAVYPTVDVDVEPSAITVSSGTYDPATDVWTTESAEGCVALDVRWNPRDIELAAPLASLQITSPFGYRLHPILGVYRLHAGTDFGTPSGSSVYVAADGVVVAAWTDPVYGRVVDVAHAGGLTTRYAHLSSIHVAIGESVTARQQIAASGCTGLCSGPHLHFETREFGVAVDPMGYLP